MSTGSLAATRDPPERAEIDLRDDVAVAILAVADAELLDIVRVVNVPACEVRRMTLSVVGAPKITCRRQIGR